MPSRLTRGAYSCPRATTGEQSILSARDSAVSDLVASPPCRESEQFANTLFGQAEQTVVTSQDSGLPRLLAVPSGVELRQLEAFVAVATELHFGRAAERLHMAAPTLSELIRRLERELGTPLFTRTTRRVALTSAGAELLTRSKGILDEIAAADAAVRR
jgi:Bacterial regulatory helix-turn-helix protein, lysR family